MLDSKYYCRVCGFYLGYPPWGEDDESPDFDICPCCGVEFGYEDSHIDAIRRYRQQWIASGAHWFSRLYAKQHKPVDWNLEEQLSKIPLEYK